MSHNPCLVPLTGLIPCPCCQAREGELRDATKRERARACRILREYIAEQRAKVPDERQVEGDYDGMYAYVAHVILGPFGDRPTSSIGGAERCPDGELHMRCTDRECMRCGALLRLPEAR
jgi:hypothetical protein